MPERLFAALQALPANQVILSGTGKTRTAAALRLDIEQLAQRLRQLGCKVLALLADNSATWVTADLAALKAGVVQLPLPGFFSDAQICHALQSTAADVMLTDQAERICGLALGFHEIGQWDGLTLLGRDIAAVELPAGTAKISFTSGSTGHPKGVCLSAEGLLDTAQAVCVALEGLPINWHLSVLPLALLLENVAGVYAPLLRGAEIVLLRLAELGWRGISGFDPLQLLRQVEAVQPDSLILVPELLKAWTQALQACSQRAPSCLQFVAVGGARCDPGLISSARAAGLPVYEGYGLTECGSVVSLNRPGEDWPGSVGHPLRHVRIRVDDEAEIHIESRAFLGYLAGEAASREFSTGDLGHRDANGYLHLSGRRGNLIITAYGRNIAPEWVEAALLAQPEIAQAVVFGEARSGLTAILVASHGAVSSKLANAVVRANATLPDYAKVGVWLPSASFTPTNGLATGNGRPIRAAILQRHADALEFLQSGQEPIHAVL